MGWGVPGGPRMIEVSWWVLVLAIVAAFTFGFIVAALMAAQKHIE